MDDYLEIEILGIALSVVGLMLVSLIETAMVSITPVRLRQLEEQGHPTAPIVGRLLRQPQQLLIGLVILINGFVLLAANLTTEVMMTPDGLSRYLGDGAVVWANALVLVVLLVVGEITPKTLSVHFAESIALRTARLALFFSYLVSPLVWLLNLVANGLLRLLTGLRILPGRVRAVPTAFSEEDIKDLISAGEQSGEVESSERDMIHGVIEFAETAAGEIMMPRTELVTLPVDAGLEEAMQAFVDSGHSRIPVYEENADNILGLLYIKDVLIRLHAREDSGGAPPTIREMMRPAYFVPESKKSDELLREMQRRRVHMAIVVDEYGGTAGIITIEDLLEEIVGDIVDEYDKERLEVTMLPDGSAVVNGLASLEKIHESFDIPIPETDAETISGLITDLLGRIPEVGDRVAVNGVEFTVEAVEHNRAERFRAVPLPEKDLPG